MFDYFYSVHWMETRDAAKHPAMHRAAPTTNYLTQNVNSAEVEKLCSMLHRDMQTPL